MNLRTELRLVCRGWLRRPLLALLVTTSVALGIGTTVLLFSIVHSLLLKPFDYPHQDRLVRLFASNPSQGYGRAGIALGDAEDFAARLRSIEELAYFLPSSRALTSASRPELVDCALVSGRFFDLFGFQTQVGRLFAEEATRPDAPPVVVVGNRFAQSRFGAASLALGKDLRLDGQRFEIVGVLTPDSSFGTRDFQVWLPFSIDRSDLDRRSHYLPVMARLGSGSTLEDAQRELTAAASQLESENPATNEGWTAAVVSFRQTIVGSVEAVLWALFAAMLVVLLICCSNVASLLLARAAARKAEAAVRSALGASRWRLVRLFLLEGLVMTLFGGALGLAFAHWGVGLLTQQSANLLPMAKTIGIDPTVLMFSALLTVSCGLLVGAVPAWRFSRQGPAAQLKDEAGRGSSGQAARFRGALTLVQTGLALVLVVAGGLILKSLMRLQATEIGFEPENTAAVQIQLSPERYSQPASQVRFFEGLIDRLKERVEVVAAGSAVPLHARGRNSLSYRLVSQAPSDSSDFAAFTSVTPNYFQTLRIPLLKGRTFDRSDHEDGVPVAVVNQALVRKAWPDSEAIGSKLSMNIRGSEETELEVVGVVGDTLLADLREPPAPAIFVSFQQFPHSGMILVFRSPGAESMLRQAEDMVFELDAQQPIYESFTVGQIVRDAGRRDRVFGTVFTVFGVFGMLLMMTGVYGVVLYSAQQREREMGIRGALGASRGQLYFELLRGSLMPAVAGLGFGLVAAALVSRYLQTLLFATDAFDPLIFGLGLGGLVVALLAAGVSAGLRVLRRNPARLLQPD